MGLPCVVLRPYTCKGREKGEHYGNELDGRVLRSLTGSVQLGSFLSRGSCMQLSNEYVHCSNFFGILLIDRDFDLTSSSSYSRAIYN